MTEPTVTGKAWILRRNWILPVIGLVAVLLGLEYDAASGVHASFGILGLLVAWIGGCVGIATLLRNAFRLPKATTYRASSTALEIAGRPTIPVDAIAEAKVRSLLIREGDTLLDLKLAKGRGLGTRTIALSLARRDAYELLEVLGIGAGGRRSAFAVGIPFTTRFLVAALLIGAPWLVLSVLEGGGSFIGLALVTVIVILPLVLFLAWILGVVKGKVVIGAEGFTVRWLRQHFVPFSAVAEIVKAESRSVVDTIVHRHDAEPIRLRAIEIPEVEAQRLAEGRALYEHIEGSFVRWKRDRGLADVGAHLRRNARSPREWLRGLDALVRGGGTSYRTAALTPELLRDVVHQTDGEADARVGAAAALIRIDRREANSRAAVRIAAEACAEPTVRIALLELAESESDEAVESALARFAPLPPLR
jgi:hypothetical protein